MVRNLKAVFGEASKDKGMCIIRVDRFYTSVALAVQLLLMGFYAIGTIISSRLGYCKDVIDKRHTRPRDVPRGSFKVSRSTKVKQMTAISW